MGHRLPGDAGAGNTRACLVQSRPQGVADAAPTILLTRPRAQAERFADACRAALPGVPVLISPILRIDPRPITHGLDGIAGLILTSENAVRALAETGLPIAGIQAWCVGDRTAEAARRIGLDATSAGGAADDLVTAILAAPDRGTLLHIRGAEARGDIAARLASSGRAAEEVIAYDQRPEPLSDEASALLTGSVPVILPLFSPRSAMLLGKAAIGSIAPLRLAALSLAVASSWAGPGPDVVAIADRPTSDHMLRRVAGLCGRNLP